LQAKSKNSKDLAERADPFIKKRLSELVKHYERRISIAVMDAVCSKRAVLLGFSEGSPMIVLFAATYPERVSRLVLVGGYTNPGGPTKRSKPSSR
jgi:pimeloyl-ACP methyl ester carboxylesterase